MESHAVPGTIQVTQRAYEHLREQYELRPRGTIEVKGKGPTTTYLLLGRRDQHARSASRDRHDQGRPDSLPGAAPSPTVQGHGPTKRERSG